METALYIYGVVGSKNRENFGNIGLHNGEVYTIEHEGIGAVVSHVPLDHSVEVEEAKIHERTLRRIMETHAVIPMGFGVTARDEAQIVNILKRAPITFKKILEKIRDKVQITVKISWEKEVLAEILRENGEIRSMSRWARKQPGNQALKVELGKRIKSVLDEEGKEYLPDVMDILKGLSDEFREKQIKGADTLMSAAFLLERDREKKFYFMVDELEKKYAKKLQILAIGPLPPYDFTGIRIDNMNFKTLEDARKTLGLGKDITIYEINSIFHRLVQECHPDLHPEDPDAAEKFREIKKARDTLIEYCEHYLCSLRRPEVDETLIIKETTP